MSWLEITINTHQSAVDDTAAALTAGGFAELVIEDQAEFETLLDENRAYWDYIDEQLQQQLQGLSRIKLYLEDTDTAGMTRLERLVENINFDDYESRNYFDQQLRKCGLFTRLEEMGIQDGDTVDIYNFEFEYQK